jgi:hypothetical protein
MGLEGVLGTILKAMFWQDPCTRFGILNLGTFLGTILDQRQTLALFNDFLGNTACGVFLGWSGSIENQLTT